jgi:AAA+ ATPase superfamily predicted ATPase
MKFYNRDKELEYLEKIEMQSKQSAQMTFLVGRRRIGKTSLLQKSTIGRTALYFFVARKNEVLLCEEFVEEIRHKLSKEVYGSFLSFKDLFGWLLELSTHTHFTLILDEFQEFYSVNASVYSEMQMLWDKYKESSKMNLILCGSVYSMMNKIFENSKEPLFGRATQRINLKEFSVQTLKEIYTDNYPNYSPEDFIAFYTITGGVAKYVELLVEAKVFSYNAILNHICSEYSLFVDEGKNVLIDEFGKDYGNYFSILSLIASSKTSRTAIESILGMQVGGFLDRLESDFGIIKKVKPIFSKPNSRSLKYQINDNFLSFWFRFFYKFRSAVEIGNFEYLRTIIQRDFNMYSGKILEKYFINKISLEGNYSQIGTYWEKGNRNEIDIVAINEIEKNIEFIEVKRNSEKINLLELKMKSQNIVKMHSGFNFIYKGLSLKDI